MRSRPFLLQSQAARSYHRACLSGNTLHAHQARIQFHHARSLHQETHSDPNPQKTKTRRGWSSTMILPSTPFPLRADACKREPLFRQKTTLDLYKWQEKQLDRELFVLHDGPPYANGQLHMGHALNKIVKDIVIRSKVLMGKRVHYHPGWDCHGLPIENKVYGQKAFKGMSPQDAPPLKVREHARAEAESSIKAQRQGFQSFGILADWSDETTYRTFDTNFIFRQIAVLREMVKNGLVYRAVRPVYWSTYSQTALAEAEIEYKDNYKSASVFVRFPIKAGPSLLRAVHGTLEAEEVLNSQSDVNLLVWTTTAWTLPANMAVNVNPTLLYSLVRPKEGPYTNQHFIVAKDRIPFLEEQLFGTNSSRKRSDEEPESVFGELQELQTFEGKELLDSTYRHPFLPHNAKNRPIIAANYVTDDAGTGLVHGAPGHGHEDYVMWQEYCKVNPEASEEEILSPVDDAGRYKTNVRLINSYHTNEGSEEKLSELTVLTEGSSKVIDLLEKSGDLILKKFISHRYPIDWRAKTPLLVRCTQQWFVNLEPIRHFALDALDKVKFTPPSGKEKLTSLIQSRAEWCISRQRVWGVPIPVLYDTATDEPLLTNESMKYINDKLATEGVDFWWKGDAIEFVPPSLRREGVTWRKGEDIIDVWFDSGSSWTMLPRQEKESWLSCTRPVADLYCEGTDQSRGWFQSSLLTFIAMKNKDSAHVSAPYKEVMTHGFILDRKRRKMSKSNTGEVMNPSFFIDGGPKTNDLAYGADVVRYWAARSEHTSDVVVSPLVIKHASDALRKIRVTCRFLISVLPKHSERETLLDDYLDDREGAPSANVQLDSIDRYMLDSLYRFEQVCRRAYAEYDFATLDRELLKMCFATLSSVYLDTSRDTLYSDAQSSLKRRTKVAILDACLRKITIVIAPIVPHLAEEIHHFYMGAKSDPKLPSSGEQEEKLPGSVFEQVWQVLPAHLSDNELQKEFEALLKLRREFFTIVSRSPRRSRVDIFIDPDEDEQRDGEQPTEKAILCKALQKHKDSLSTFFGFPSVNLLNDRRELQEREANEESILGNYRGLPYHVRPALSSECPRCRQFNRQESERELCTRCSDVVSQLSS